MMKGINGLNGVEITVIVMVMGEGNDMDGRERGDGTGGRHISLRANPLEGRGPLREEGIGNYSEFPIEVNELSGMAQPHVGQTMDIGVPVGEGRGVDRESEWEEAIVLVVGSRGGRGMRDRDRDRGMCLLSVKDVLGRGNMSLSWGEGINLRVPSLPQPLIY